MNLKTPIHHLSGLSESKVLLLQKELNIFTFEDLISYYPFRYEDRTRFHKVKDLHSGLPNVQVIARILSKEIAGEKQARRLVISVKDETGVMELVWFKGLRWIDKMLQPRMLVVAFGKPNEFGGKISMAHPEVEIYDAKAVRKGSLTLQPVYNSTQKLKNAFLDSKGIQRLQSALILQLSADYETLPKWLIEKYKLISRKQALQSIHFPASAEALDGATYRLKFEELFLLQLKLLRARIVRGERFKGFVFSSVGSRFNTFYTEKLRFDLTSAQKRVLREIRYDTQRGVQMNRLLQGDVGSGKTVVAFMCMLLAIDNGYQACMMAPTEILAKQHYSTIRELAGDGFITCAILTGSTSKKERRRIHESLIDGSIDLLVGTHALIEDEVRFKELGFAVIDEQHRFGVEQRARLWRKNKVPPHMLVMTATPIPRTLAMTLYGDLDVSIIDELPAGRKPIQTLHLVESQRLKMYGLIRREIALGRQVYIVYPLIKESEKLDLIHLEAGIDHISRQFPLPQYAISIVHGKLKPADKEFEMQRFVKGETQIMVATTVIEVGVNVPNASVMVIENAERFGLSQLHQLRGRVGRGAEQSFCILMSGSKISREGRKRLETMVRTNDGFEIAETDLELRGPGNIEGTEQSGILELNLANLAVDQPLLQLVRAEVIELFDEDPHLELDKNRLLKEYFLRKETGIGWNKIS